MLQCLEQLIESKRHIEGQILQQGLLNTSGMVCDLFNFNYFRAPQNC